MDKTQHLAPCPHLEPCPWCGCALHAIWRKSNPRASCKTEGCFGLKMAVVNLDDPSDVAAWNRREHAKLMLIMHTGMWISFDVLDERQAHRNHGQTLARLAERGGLNAAEALFIAERRAYKHVHTKDAIVALSALAAAASHQADAAEMLLRRLVQRHRAGRDLVQPEEWPAVEAVAMRNASPLR